MKRASIVACGALLLAACREPVEQVVAEAAPTVQDCRAQPACAAEGKCTPWPDEKSPSECIVGSTADCQRSEGCRNEGRCTLVEPPPNPYRVADAAPANACFPGSNRECAQSQACQIEGRCVVDEGEMDSGLGGPKLCHKPTDAPAPEPDVWDDLLGPCDTSPIPSDGWTPAKPIQKHGQIAAMDVPADWREAHFVRITGPTLLRQINPPESTDVSLCLRTHPLQGYVRGTDTVVDVGLTLVEILRAPPHELDQTERASLADLLGPRVTDAFVATQIATQDWNGRRVLVVEGRDSKSDRSVFALYVDAQGNAQELAVVTAADADPKLGEAARAALQSVEWIR